MRLSEAISQVLAEPKNEILRSEAYSQFLQSTLVVPTLKTEDEPSFNTVLSQTLDNHRFIPIFSEQRFLKIWAGQSLNNFSFIHMKGSNLIELLGENDYLCLDLNTPHYKEFSPEECAYLLKIVDEVVDKNSNLA